MTFSSQYLVAANLLLLALVAYSASSIVGTIIAGRLEPPAHVDLAPPPAAVPAEAPKSASYYRVIVRRDLFNSVKDVEPTPVPVPKGPPPDLALWGVVLSDEEGRSYCVIEDKKARKQKLYRISDTIEGTDLAVKSIDWKTVILDRNGQELVLTLQEPNTRSGKSKKKYGRPFTRNSKTSNSGIQKTGKNEYVIERSEVDGALENMSQLFTQVRAVPHFEGGKPTGFRLFAIRRGSLFDKIGLRNGDILRKINDIEFNDPSRALALMQELRNVDELRVEIIRNRRPQTLSYQIR